jgi:hypothetical protein
MKKAKTRNYFELMEEAGKKYGVKVTNMPKRRIRAIGFLSGAENPDQRPDKVLRSIVVADDNCLRSLVLGVNEENILVRIANLTMHG